MRRTHLYCGARAIRPPSSQLLAHSIGGRLRRAIARVPPRRTPQPACLARLLGRMGRVDCHLTLNKGQGVPAEGMSCRHFWASKRCAERSQRFCAAAAATAGPCARRQRKRLAAPDFKRVHSSKNDRHCIWLWVRCSDAPPSATPTQITLLTHQEASKMLRRALATLACVLALAALATAGKGV